MAKVSITHRCGHESTENLTGKQSDRDRRKAWLEGGDCPSCYTTKRNAEAADAAAKIEAELGLPETGQREVLDRPAQLRCIFERALGG